MIVPVDKIQRFKLSDSFIDDFRHEPPQWGFGDLSYVVYKRTYARELPGGETEEWWQTCKRVIEGMFTVQKAHCKTIGVPWDNRKAQRSAQEAYERMFSFKWLPPGRGLWMMGTDFVYEKGGAALNNCGFTSTQNIDVDFAQPFCWQFGMSMLGVGVGFDTRGVGKFTIQAPRDSEDSFIIEDSREGWIEALRVLLTAFSGKGAVPASWDSSKIRLKGTPIKGFGGVASGPGPLLEMLERVEKLLRSNIGVSITSEIITDIMNLVGKCVVSGGVRRTAQIAFGDPADQEFIELKRDTEKLNDYRWASNNSIFAEVGMDYTGPAASTAVNGEPGYAWIENMRRYGRMIDPPNNLDYRAMGGNPCLEQTLEDNELCCLVETFPFRHDSLEDYQRTLKFAYLYAKTVTLIPTHDPMTNAVMMRNRRIGCSMSGVDQAISRWGLAEYRRWCDEGYKYLGKLDRIYSEWMCIPMSIKRSSIKPSGTVSLLAGATPGGHWGYAQFMIRRIRVADTSPIWRAAQAAGYKVEDDVYAPHTKVIEFPTKYDYIERTENDVTIWEQVSRVAMLQSYWADNQVSYTVKFKPEEACDIPRVLEYFEDRLKGISFLPYSDHGYQQAPYEEISEEVYNDMLANIQPMDLARSYHEADDKFCDGEACTISFN